MPIALPAAAAARRRGAQDQPPGRPLPPQQSRNVGFRAREFRSVRPVPAPGGPTIVRRLCRDGHGHRRPEPPAEAVRRVRRESDRRPAATCRRLRGRGSARRDRPPARRTRGRVGACVIMARAAGPRSARRSPSACRRHRPGRGGSPPRSARYALR